MAGSSRPIAQAKGPEAIRQASVYDVQWTILRGLVQDIVNRIAWHDSNDNGDGRNVTLVVRVPLPNDAGQRTLGQHVISLRRPWIWRRKNRCSEGVPEPDKSHSEQPRLGVRDPLQGLLFSNTHAVSKDVNYFVRTCLCGSVVVTDTRLRHASDFAPERLQTGLCGTALLEYLSSFEMPEDAVAKASYSARLCNWENSRLPSTTLRRLADTTASVSYAIYGYFVGRRKSKEGEKSVPLMFEQNVAFEESDKQGTRHEIKLDCVLAAARAADTAYLVGRCAGAFLERNNYVLPASDSARGASTRLPPAVMQMFCRLWSPKKRAKEPRVKKPLTVEREESEYLFQEAITNGGLLSTEILVIASWLGIHAPHMFVAGYRQREFDDFCRRCQSAGAEVTTDLALRTLFAGPGGEQFQRTKLPLSVYDSNDLDVYKSVVIKSAVEADPSRLQAWLVQALPLTVGRRAQDLQECFTSFANGKYVQHSIGRLSSWNPVDHVDTTTNAHNWRSVVDVVRYTLGIDNLALMVSIDDTVPHTEEPMRASLPETDAVFTASAVSPFMVDVIGILIDGLLEGGESENENSRSLKRNTDEALFDGVLRRFLLSLAVFSILWVRTGKIPQDYSLMWSPARSLACLDGLTPRRLKLAEDAFWSWKKILQKSFPTFARFGVPIVQSCPGAERPSRTCKAPQKFVEAGGSTSEVVEDTVEETGIGRNSTVPLPEDPPPPSGNTHMPADVPTRLSCGSHASQNLANTGRGSGHRSPRTPRTPSPGSLYRGDRAWDNRRRYTAHGNRGTRPKPFPYRRSPQRNQWSAERCFVHRLGYKRGLLHSQQPYQVHVACFQSLLFEVLHHDWRGAFEGGSRDISTPCTPFHKQPLLDAYFSSPFDFGDMLASGLWNDVWIRVCHRLREIQNLGAPAVAGPASGISRGPAPRYCGEGGLHKLTKYTRLAMSNTPIHLEMMDRNFEVVDIGCLQARDVRRECGTCLQGDVHCGGPGCRGKRSHSTMAQDSTTSPTHRHSIALVRVRVVNCSVPEWTRSKALVSLVFNGRHDATVAYMTREKTDMDVPDEDGDDWFEIAVSVDIAKSFHQEGNNPGACCAYFIESLYDELSILNNIEDMRHVLLYGSVVATEETRLRNPSAHHRRIQNLYKSILAQVCDPQTYFEGGGPQVRAEVPACEPRFTYDVRSSKVVVANAIQSLGDTWVKYLISANLANSEQTGILQDVLSITTRAHVDAGGDGEGRVPIVTVTGPPGTGKSYLAKLVANLFLLPARGLSRDAKLSTIGPEVLILLVSARNNTTDDCLGHFLKENALFTASKEHYLCPRVVRFGDYSESDNPEVQAVTLCRLVECTYEELPPPWKTLPRANAEKLKGYKEQRQNLCREREENVVTVFPSGQSSDDDTEEEENAGYWDLVANTGRQRKMFLAYAHILAGTMGSVLHDAIRDVKDRNITHTIVEEASLTPETDFFFVLTSRLAKYGIAPQLVFCIGDENQGHVFTRIKDPIARMRASQSPFARLQFAAGDKRYMLTKQYRTHPELVPLFSNLFYGGALESACPPDVYSREYVTSGPFRPDMWLDSGCNRAGAPFLPVSSPPRCGEVQYFEAFDAKSKGIVNRYEVTVVVHFIRKFLATAEAEAVSRFQRTGKVPIILVIAPYKVQVRSILHELDREDAVKRSIYTVLCRTMDSSQGMESEVTIMSLTRSRHYVGGSDLSFIGQRCQVNVALSRQQCLRVIVGNAGYLESSANEAGNPWPIVIQDYNARNRVWIADDYLPSLAQSGALRLCTL